MNDNGSTHRATLEKEVRDKANSCDLGEFNRKFFLSSCFIDDMVEIVQQKEAAAYQRGLISNPTTHGNANARSKRL